MKKYRIYEFLDTTDNTIYYKIKINNNQTEYFSELGLAEECQEMLKACDAAWCKKKSNIEIDDDEYSYEELNEKLFNFCGDNHTPASLFSSINK
jgi:hypothetical protein